MIHDISFNDAERLNDNKKNPDSLLSQDFLITHLNNFLLGLVN